MIAASIALGSRDADSDRHPDGEPQLVGRTSRSSDRRPRRGRSRRRGSEPAARGSAARGSPAAGAPPTGRSNRSRARSNSSSCCSARTREIASDVAYPWSSRISPRRRSGCSSLQRESVIELLRGHGSVANEQRPEGGPPVARAPDRFHPSPIGSRVPLVEIGAPIGSRAGRLCRCGSSSSGSRERASPSTGGRRRDRAGLLVLLGVATETRPRSATGWPARSRGSASSRRATGSSTARCSMSVARASSSASSRCSRTPQGQPPGFSDAARPEVARAARTSASAPPFPARRPGRDGRLRSADERRARQRRPCHDRPRLRRTAARVAMASGAVLSSLYRISLLDEMGAWRPFLLRRCGEE